MGDMEAYNAQLGFWDPKKRGDAKIRVVGYDNSVYSNGQNMRMIYQTKPGSTPIPKRPSNFEEYPAKHAIQFLNKSDLECAEEIKIDVKLVASQPAPKPTKKSTPKTTKKSTKKPAQKANMNENIFDLDTTYDPAKLSAIVSRITSRYDYEDWIKRSFLGSIILLVAMISDLN